MFLKKLLISVWIIIFISYPAIAMAALVECSSSTVCQISVYRSDMPNMYSKYILQLIPPVDESGNPVSIPDGDSVNFKFEGVSTTIICNDSWQNFLPDAHADEIQNRIKCTVDSSRTKANVALQIYDPNTYTNTYSSPPSYTYFELDNTNENSPVCAEDNTLAVSSACKWQKQNNGNSILNEQGVPLNYWVVYSKTSVNGLSMSYSVNSEDASPYEPSDSVCAVDLNNNGTVDSEEIQLCVQIGETRFCPVDAVECTATYIDAICPTGSTLNTGTDKCEATPEISCNATGYHYDQNPDKCMTDPICAAGGLYNPKTDKCEIVVSDNLCPAGYTYNSDLDACTKAIVCPAGGVYNSREDKCELSPDYNCPENFSYNGSTGKCEAGVSCSDGSYNTATDRCEQNAQVKCPDGYIYDSNNGVCTKNATCFGGGILNVSQDKCEATVIDTCPEGYTKDPDNICRRNAVCPTGMTYSANRHECIADDTPVCSSGFTYDNVNDLCWQAATCVNGGSLNSPRNKCQKNPDISCSVSGYAYNSLVDMCESSPSCPSDSSYDTNLDVCVEGVIWNCSNLPNYTYNVSTGKCQKEPDCPNGSTYNASTDRCESQVSWSCPVNSNTFTNQSTCESGCIQTETCTGNQEQYYGGNGTSLGWSYGFEVSDGQIRAIHRGVPWGDTEYGNWVPLNGNGISLPAHSNGIEVSNGQIRAITNVLPFYVGPGNWVSLNGNGISTILYPRENTTFSIEVNNGWIRQVEVYRGYVYPGNWVQILFNSQSFTCSLSGLSYFSSTECQNDCYQSISCTGVCPLDYNVDGNLCIANPICSGSGNLNTSSDLCEFAPSPACTSPFTYDSASGYCYTNADCGSGSLNNNRDKCQMNSVRTCTGSYTYQSSMDMCETSPSCPSGSSYDTDQDRCENSVTHQCPVGTYNTATGQCESDYSCPGGGILNSENDKCELNVTHECVAGYTYNPSLNVCQALPACTNPGSYNTIIDLCTIQEDWLCPSPMTISGTICYMSSDCPAGGGLNKTTNLCESDVQIACDTDAGYSYNNVRQTCQSAPVCSSGFFDNNLDLCKLSAEKLCPDSYIFNHSRDNCYREPECSATGSLLSPLFDQCIMDAIHDCPNNTSYSVASRLCESIPVCSEGTYNAEMNKCYKGDNTCPYGEQYSCLSYQGKNMCSAQECVQYGGATEVEDQPEGTNDKHDDGQYSDDGQCMGQIYIFNGNDRRCRSGGLTIAFKNCCQDEKYLFGLLQCKPKEIQLAKLKAKGLCHEIGEYCSKKIKLGFAKICIEHKKSYCCFTSKLSRIVHEQGRPQMISDINNWGAAEGPHCRGFTPEEFQMLDFSTIDLSEWYGDIIPTTQEHVENKMQQSIQRFYDKFD